MNQNDKVRKIEVLKNVKSIKTKKHKMEVEIQKKDGSTEEVMWRDVEETMGFVKEVFAVHKKHIVFYLNRGKRKTRNAKVTVWANIITTNFFGEKKYWKIWVKSCYGLTGKIEKKEEKAIEECCLEIGDFVRFKPSEIDSVKISRLIK